MPVFVGVGVCVGVDVGVSVWVSVAVGEGVSVCVGVIDGVEVMACGWKTYAALASRRMPSGRTSAGGMATMGCVAVGSGAAEGADKYPSSINSAITASPTSGSWLPYIAWADSSITNNDTPHVSGRRATIRIRAFRKWYLRRGGGTRRSGRVISSILILLLTLKARVRHSKGVLMTAGEGVKHENQASFLVNEVPIR